TWHFSAGYHSASNYYCTINGVTVAYFYIYTLSSVRMEASSLATAAQMQECANGVSLGSVFPSGSPWVAAEIVVSVQTELYLCGELLTASDNVTIVMEPGCGEVQCGTELVFFGNIPTWTES